MSEFKEARKAALIAFMEAGPGGIRHDCGSDYQCDAVIDAFLAELNKTHYILNPRELKERIADAIRKEDQQRA